MHLTKGGFLLVGEVNLTVIIEKKTMGGEMGF